MEAFGIIALLLGVIYLAFFICGIYFLFLFGAEKPIPPILFRLWEGMAMFYSLLSTTTGGATNDCCSVSATFSPDHAWSVYVLIVICTIAYFYSSYRKKIVSPVLEVIVNCLLLVGIILNIFVAIQIKEWIEGIFMNMPAMILPIFRLIKNHRLVLEMIEEGEGGPEGKIQGLCRRILQAKPVYKIPVLLILCLPLLVVLTAILLLFGQKPDSMIRAFTDTYKHGFSQLDHQCDGVICPGEGHFLCTIAAQGHVSIVQPLRSGVRGGRRITCNRQLLVSNAFEELLEKKLPAIHRPVRRFYNRIGRLIDRHYGIFDNKWVSDLIYILMKPLEWFFLIILYTFDARPENRIAQQYMSAPDRAALFPPKPS